MEKSHKAEGGRESPGCPLTYGAENHTDAHQGFGKAFIESPAVILWAVGVTSCGAAWWGHP